jgi:hypothetical protein
MACGAFYTENDFQLPGGERSYVINVRQQLTANGRAHSSHVRGLQKITNTAHIEINYAHYFSIFSTLPLPCWTAGGRVTRCTGDYRNVFPMEPAAMGCVAIRMIADTEERGVQATRRHADDYLAVIAKVAANRAHPYEAIIRESSRGNVGRAWDCGRSFAGAPLDHQASARA